MDRKRARILAGMLMVASPFLPWITVVTRGPGKYADYRIWLTLLNLYSYEGLLEPLVPLQPMEFKPPIALIAMGLLIVGGAACFYLEGIGGSMGLAGMITFTLFASCLLHNTVPYHLSTGTGLSQYASSTPIMLTFSPEIGFFLGWGGSILGVVYALIRRRDVV